MMKIQKTKDPILKIMNNPEKIREAIQAGIKSALLKHKQAGNPVCEIKNNKVVWIKPSKIRIN